MLHLELRLTDQVVAARDGDAADHRGRRDHEAGGDRDVLRQPPAVGLVEDDPDQDAAEEAADVGADRDARDREGEDEVDQRRQQQARLPQVDAARARLDDQRAEQAEGGAGGTERRDANANTCRISSRLVTW